MNAKSDYEKSNDHSWATEIKTAQNASVTSSTVGKERGRLTEAIHPIPQCPCHHEKQSSHK
jgi:hypothetical protein